MQKSKLKLFLIVALVTAFWSPVNIMIKLGMEDFGLGLIGIFRWFVIAGVMWLLLSQPRFRSAYHVKMPPWNDGLWALLAGVFCLGPSNTLYYIALQNTTSSTGVVLNTTGPIWSSLFAILFLGEFVSIRRWGVIALSCFGAYIVTIGFGLPDLQGASTVANLLYLLGVMLEALAVVLTTRVVLRSSGVVGLALKATGTTIWFVIIALLMPNVFPVTIKQVSSVGILAMGYLSLIGGVGCFLVWYTIAKRTPLSLMVIGLGVEPLLGSVLGYFILKEEITQNMIFGTAFVLISLVIAATEKSSPATASACKMSANQADQNA